MKQKLRSLIFYIPAAILPCVAFLAVFYFSKTFWFEYTIFFPFIAAATTACLLNAILPIKGGGRKFLIVTIPSFLVFLVALSILPLFTDLEIHEPEDYIVYVFYCVAIPLTGLFFWVTITFFSWLGAGLRIRFDERKTLPPSPKRRFGWQWLPLILAGLAILCWVVSYLETQAQLKALSSSGWEVHPFSKKALLDSERIDEIRMDQQGNPWVSTSNGIYHRVGTKWEKFLESSPFVTYDMAVDQQNRLWVQTLRGNYMIDEQGAHPQDKNHWPVFDEKKKTWYFCAPHTLCDESGEQKVNLGEKSFLAFDRKGKVWSYDFGIDFEKPGATITVYDGLQSKDTWIAGYLIAIGANPVYGFDNESNLWLSVGKIADSCCRLAHIKDGQLEIVEIPFSGHNAQITGVAFDSKNHLWVSGISKDNGLAMKDGDQWTLYKTASLTDSGQSSNVGAIFIDDQDRLWFGAGLSLVSLNLVGADLPANKSTLDDLTGITRIKQISQIGVIIFIISALISGIVILTISLRSKG
jgi:streptogramin lyase